MSSSSLLPIAFCVGILLVLQGVINARLGTLLNNSLLATSVSLITSACLTIITALATVKHMPDNNQIQTVPAYMWFIGGLLSFIAMSVLYYIIPRAGISSTITFGLFGQIIFAAIVGNYGWFGMPIEPLSLKKLIGIIIMITGIVIIKH